MWMTGVPPSQRKVFKRIADDGCEVENEGVPDEVMKRKYLASLDKITRVRLTCMKLSDRQFSLIHSICLTQYYILDANHPRRAAG